MGIQMQANERKVLKWTGNRQQSGLGTRFERRTRFLVAIGHHDHRFGGTFAGLVPFPERFQPHVAAFEQHPIRHSITQQ